MTETLNIARLTVTSLLVHHAEGDYYQGASKNAAAQFSQIDTISTGSISAP